MRDLRTHRKWSLLVLGLALLLGPGAGCHPPATHPKTYAAKGKVVYKDGRPMDGGFIEFRGISDAMLRANGDIQPDGSFTLLTPTERERLPGAQPGEYAVMIIPKQEGDQTQQTMLPPINVPGTYKIKPEENNDFTITVERPKQRS
jgi:hypothetical protein